MIQGRSYRIGCSSRFITIQTNIANTKIVCCCYSMYSNIHTRCMCDTHVCGDIHNIPVYYEQNPQAGSVPLLYCCWCVSARGDMFDVRVLVHQQVPHTFAYINVTASNTTNTMEELFQVKFSSQTETQRDEKKGDQGAGTAFLNHCITHT